MEAAGAATDCHGYPRIITERGLAYERSWAMPHYRCYCLSGDNRIVAVAEETHTDDTAAVQWAEDLYAGGAHKHCFGIELWRNAHLVHRKARGV